MSNVEEVIESTDLCASSDRRPDNKEKSKFGKRDEQDEPTEHQPRPVRALNYKKSERAVKAPHDCKRD